MFLPSGERYALGEDGYPKEPEDLIEGLENRLREDRNLAERLREIQY